MPSIPDLLNAWQASVIKGNPAEISALAKSDEVSYSRRFTLKRSLLHIDIHIIGPIKRS